MSEVLGVLFLLGGWGLAIYGAFLISGPAGLIACGIVAAGLGAGILAS